MKKNILLILFAILAFALALIITSPFFKNFRNRFINAEKILGIKKIFLKIMEMIKQMKNQNLQ